MADSDFVVSSKRKIREGEVAANRPNSEAVNQVIAGNINSFVDGDYKVVELNLGGYFSTSSLFSQAPVYIPRTTDIIRYDLSILDSGSSGVNSINFDVLDEDFNFVDTIFSGVDQPRINAASGSCTISKDVVADSDVKIESTAHTTDIGSLNLSTIQGGYIIRGNVTSFATSARSIRLKLYLREQ